MITEARDLALMRFGSELPQQWRHIEAVAREAERIAPAYGADATVLTTTAWVLDVGYARDIVDTGLHALDGARFLRDNNWLSRIVDLVAHHSGAVFEAKVRGMYRDMLEFADEASPTRDALWYCDLTVDADGRRVDVEDRLAELSARNGPGEVGSRFVHQARDELVAAVRRTRRVLRSAGLEPG